MSKKKKWTLKRVFKLIVGIIIFFTLPSLLLFGFLYFKYNEVLPEGIEGEQADQLASKMLNALNYNAYKTTDYIEWTFKKRHHFKWNKTENTCQVYWSDYKVFLDFNDKSKSEAFKNNTKIKEANQKKYIKKANDLFNNDSFWVVAPYKVFDKGVKRKLVTLDNNKKSLLVTYTSGGSTPGDSYLWHLDDKGKPIYFQMWVSVLPIGGLKATWKDWTTTKTGAVLPTFHKLLFLGLDITDIKTVPNSITTYYYPNSFSYNKAKNKIEIQLDSLTNFNDLLEVLKATQCKKQTPVLNFSDATSKFKLISPFIYCQKSKHDYKCEEVLELKKDSLSFCDIRKPVDSLPKYLKAFLTNTRDKQKYPQNFIQVSLKNSQEINATKNKLIKLSHAYNQIKKENTKKMSLSVKFSNQVSKNINVIKKNN